MSVRKVQRALTLSAAQPAERAVRAAIAAAKADDVLEADEADVLEALPQVYALDAATSADLRRALAAPRASGRPVGRPVDAVRLAKRAAERGGFWALSPAMRARPDVAAVAVYSGDTSAMTRACGAAAADLDLAKAAVQADPATFFSLPPAMRERRELLLFTLGCLQPCFPFARFDRELLAQHLETYVLEPELLRRRCARVGEEPTAIAAELERMQREEPARFAALSARTARAGIRHAERLVDVAMLERLLADREAPASDPRPVVAISAPESDWNGAFMALGEGVVAPLLASHRVIYFDSASDAEMASALDAYAPEGVDELVIAGHGSATLLALTAPGMFDHQTLDTTDADIAARLRARLRRKARVWLLSCETAHGRGAGDLAGFLARHLGVPVTAPVESVPIGFVDVAHGRIVGFDFFGGEAVRVVPR